MNAIGKIVAWTTICCTLFSGCYSQMAVTESEPLPDDVAVVFYLKDASRVESEPGQHTRIDGGYLVTGTLLKGKVAQEPFEGTVRDTDIQKLTAEKLNNARTAIGGILAAVGIGLAVGLISLTSNGAFGR